MSASREEVRWLLEQQGYKCALTGVELTPETFSLDHVVSIADGGSDEIENLQAVDMVANQMKGQLSDQEFRRLCGLVAGTQPHVYKPIERVQNVPSGYEWPADLPKNWNDLSTDKQRDRFREESSKREAARRASAEPAST